MYPFTLHWSILGHGFEFGPYTLFFLLAAVTAFVGSFFFSVRRGFKGKKVLIVLLVMLLLAVVGARLLNAMIHLNLYTKDPERLFELSATGFSLYGGILMATVSGYLTCKMLRINPFKLGDTFIPFLGIGIALMRVGCFLNGCCFGKETDLPWAVKFPLLSPAHLYQMTLYGNLMDVRVVHPTQLYELIAVLLLSAFSFFALKRKWADGTVLFIFLTAFSLFRLFNSYLRVNPLPLSAPSFFYPLLYLSIIVFGMVFIWKRNTAKKD